MVTGAVTEEGELRRVEVHLIRRGRYQPRLDFPLESLQELADSIRAQGVVQPIVVRPIGGGCYEIIAGERRWRATQLAGLHDIPAVVRDVSDRAAVAMALAENIQREDLNPIEEAHAIQRMVTELGMKHEEIAAEVGYSRTRVTNTLRLLKLGPVATDLVRAGKLDETKARALVGLGENDQAALAREIVAKDLKGAEVERRVRLLKSPPQGAGASGRDPNVRRLEEELTDQVGNRVRIPAYADGKGTLEISFHSAEELEGILERLRRGR